MWNSVHVFCVCFCVYTCWPGIRTFPHQVIVRHSLGMTALLCGQTSFSCSTGLGESLCLLVFNHHILIPFLILSVLWCIFSPSIGLRKHIVYFKILKYSPQTTERVWCFNAMLNADVIPVYKYFELKIPSKLLRGSALLLDILESNMDIPV